MVFKLFAFISVITSRVEKTVIEDSFLIPSNNLLNKGKYFDWIF